MRRGGTGLTEPLPNELLVYRSPTWGYQLRRPAPWYERPLEVEGGQGVLFAPDPEILTTVLSVEIRDLSTVVTPEDLPDLEQGFLSGLRAVPDSQLMEHEAFENPFALGIDAVQTYVESGQRRKRWIRLLFKGALQARVIAQAATIDEYDRLRPLFAPCMTTFMFGDG
jgi:hypothetical protein